MSIEYNDDIRAAGWVPIPEGVNFPEIKVAERAVTDEIRSAGIRFFALLNPNDSSRVWVRATHDFNPRDNCIMDVSTRGEVGKDVLRFLTTVDSTRAQAKRALRDIQGADKNPLSV